ncbi:HD-GYP domain-containing protein (c-di-GMP phosphodiesterase class II) [Cytobacillus eiseniae]|uniref:HD-GYP domain-containing protein (C-di-GMP phosphodiesterase class II) n=1 Tax=Cytobacillus eiseniae TaxID=762947 RepID=A0ABS4RHX9_9BACI|nr:HD domain-containing phosphohydrolase [Cytobacillus eiseniae]MBP2242006.1 HD-GYP domain-containing protein (c-di-GMP phosphodiesterase class II) [Cytobacillus eiseniae]
MVQTEISFDLVGSALGEDIFSEQGILLLKKGTILKEIHVLLLQKYRFGTKVAMEQSSKSKPIQRKLQSAQPYQSIQSYISQTFQEFHQMKEIDLPELRKRYHSLIQLALEDIAILKVLHTKGEDLITLKSINVGILSAIIGKLLGLEKKDCYLLAEMGLFHEIGMIGMDGENEQTQIEKHTENGYKLLKLIPNINPLVPLSALLHHERMNGSGYPTNRKEGGIPYFVQIVSVADHFNDIYMNLHQEGDNPHFTSVYDLIEESQVNLLNPAIVLPFVRYLMRQNISEKVMLSNGEEAEIVFIHENEPYQPLVKMNGEYVDLRKESDIKLVHLIDQTPEDARNYHIV